MTIKDIAKMAEVSTAAVSRYFNNGYVSEEKRIAIKKVVEKTGYFPSMQAQTLRTKRTNLIGVIIPRIDSTSIARIVGGIMETAEERDYQLLIANTMNNSMKELEYLSILREKQVDGVILIGTIFSDEHKDVLSTVEVPLVIVGQKLEGYNCVYHDDYHAEYDITKLLLEKGRRKLVYIGVTEDDEAVGMTRYRGYRDAVIEQGLPELAERRVISGFDARDGYYAMETLLETYNEIDGVVAATDTIASGAIKYLHKKGIKIPEDIMVVGQGDSKLAQIITPELSTVRYYYEESGRAAAKIIIEDIKSDKDEIPVRMVKLGYELIDRESTWT